MHSVRLVVNLLGAERRLYGYVAVGGMAGALGRMAVGEWAVGLAAGGFPWTTLGVNVAGSFLLGVFAYYLPATLLRPELRALLTVGFCGGFTTFSAFAYDAIELSAGGYVAAASYSALSVTVAPLAAFAGMAIAEAALRRNV